MTFKGVCDALGMSGLPHGGAQLGREMPHVRHVLAEGQAELRSQVEGRGGEGCRF